MEGACLDHQNSTIFKSGEMAFCADDRLGRQAYSIRPSDRDSFQQVQRRYSVAQATIRAVSPDWEDAVTALKPLRAHDEADMSLPLSPPPSAPSSDAVSMSSPAHLPTDPLPMTEIKSLETLAPKSPDRQKRPDVSPTLDRSRKALLVRSRTKTLEERPPRPPCQVFALSPSDSVPPPQPSPHPPSLDRARADSVVSPFPLTGNNVNGAASETRKLRRNRQRSINNPSGPPPPPPPAESSSIIKVGKLSCWAASASISSSTSSISSVSRTRAGRIGRRARAGSHRWQAISAVLRDNGELKLFDETEITVVSVVRLSKLSRRAVQQLHPSVLDERFGIAIYPQYAISLSAMIPIRPIYLALDSRIQFEAWWALLRAFAVPELFGPDASSAGTDARPPSSSSSSSSPHIFRLERSVFLRIVEARVRPPRPRTGPEKKPSTTTSSSTMTADDAAAERYFVEVCMDGVTRARTLPRPALADLFWREDFDFADLPQSVTTATAILKKGVGPSVSKPYVEHPGTMAREESGITVCGTVTLDLEKALHHDDVEGWYPALDKDAQMIGDMFLRLRVEELVVLTMQEYSALSEVLHRHSSGLVALIARVLPKRLQRLSEIFVNIYQVSGHLDRWLKDLAETEIEAAYQKSTAASSARSMSRAGSEMSYESSGERELLVHELGKAVTTEVNLLFRGNSLLTRSMDFYMRRLGKDYLEETLRDVLTEINSAAIDCEVDPTRVHSPADLSRNWSSLVNHFRKVWMTIHESASRCPREMRLLLRHIRSCCDERFGTLHHTVRYSSVSGFLFLRFFCPAVLNPKLFGLLPDHPRPLAQRTFTLIAKSLQGLANMSSFGSKERWMEPMNSHLVVHRQEFLGFVDAICAVSNPQSPPQVRPPAYATPITILARLPSTHREGFPSLPYLIDEAREYALLVSFWLDADLAAGAAAAEASGEDLLRFHKICVDLKSRAQDCVQRTERQANQANRADQTWSDPQSFPHRLNKGSTARPVLTRNTTSKSSLTRLLTTTTTTTTTTTVMGHHPTSSQDLMNYHQQQLLLQQQQQFPSRGGSRSDASVLSSTTVYNGQSRPSVESDHPRSSTPLSRDGAKQMLTDLVAGFWKKAR